MLNYLFRDYKNKLILRVGGILVVSLLLLSTSAAASTTMAGLDTESSSAVEALDAPTSDSIFAQEGPPQNPATPVTGDNVTLPVVLVEFQDAKHTYSSQEMQKRIFGPHANDPSIPAERRGVRNYYYNVSDGNLDYHPGPGVIGWHTVNQRRADVAQGDSESFIRSALSDLDTETDFRNYDSDDNNRMNIVLIYQSSGSTSNSALRPRYMSLSQPYVTNNNVKIEGVSLVPEQKSRNDVVDLWVQQIGHLMFRWGELYETPNSQRTDIFMSPTWSLMGIGNDATSSHPLSPLAWRKTTTGWADTPTFRESGILPISSKANDFYSANPENSDADVRFLSFRQPIGDDGALPDLHRDKVDDRSIEQWNRKQMRKALEANYRGLVSTETNIGHSASTTRWQSAKLFIEFIKNSDTFENNGDSKQINHWADTVLLGNPPRTSLDATSKLVYAMDVPEGRTTVGARASWKNPSAKMNITLESPSGKKYHTKNKGPQSAANGNILGTYASVHTAETPEPGSWKVTMNADRSVEFYHSQTENTEVLPDDIEINVPDYRKIYTDDYTLEFEVEVTADGNPYPQRTSGGLNNSNFVLTLNGKQVISNQTSVQQTGTGTYKITAKLEDKLLKGSRNNVQVQTKVTKFGGDYITDPATYKFKVENDPPEAKFDWFTDGHTVHFNSRSTDKDGTIDKVEWDFGDGSNSTKSEVSHSYENVRGYPVTLRVTDDDGATSQITSNVRPSRSSSSARPPNAEMKTERSIFTMTFAADNVTAPDEQIAGYDWDFGDGDSTDSSLESKEVSHSYSTPGEYTVSLTVYDTNGNVRTIVTKVHVTLDGTYEIRNVQNGNLLTARNDDMVSEPDYGKKERLWQITETETNVPGQDGVAGNVTTFRITSATEGKSIVKNLRLYPFWDYSNLNIWSSGLNANWIITQNDIQENYYTILNTFPPEGHLGLQGSKDVEVNTRGSRSERSNETRNQWQFTEVSS